MVVVVKRGSSGRAAAGALLSKCCTLILLNGHHRDRASDQNKADQLAVLVVHDARSHRAPLSPLLAQPAPLSPPSIAHARPAIPSSPQSIAAVV